jgi:hypothetical protein
VVIYKYKKNIWLIWGFYFLFSAGEKDDANEKESGKVEDFTHRAKVGLATI